MASIFPMGTKTIFIETEELDGPGVRAAWAKRCGLSLATIEFPTAGNGTTSPAAQAGYMDDIKEVHSTLGYLKSSRDVLLKDVGTSPVTFADIGCRTPADSYELMNEVPNGSTVIFCDPSLDALDKIPYMDRSITTSHVMAKKFTAASNNSRIFEQDVDRARYIRVMQQTKPEDMRAVANEARRILKPGGKALFVDLDWNGMSVDNHGLQGLISRYASELANPVPNKNAAIYTPNVLRDAGFSDVTTEQAIIKSSLIDKFKLWSGVPRIVE